MILKTTITKKIHIDKLSKMAEISFTSIANAEFDFFTNLTDHHDHRQLVVFAKFSAMPMMMPKITMLYNVVTFSTFILNEFHNAIEQIIALYNITAGSSNLKRRDILVRLIRIYDIVPTAKLRMASNRLRKLLGLQTDNYYGVYIEMPNHFYDFEACELIDECIRGYASIDKLIPMDCVYSHI
jgi:hypothetical protein